MKFSPVNGIGSCSCELLFLSFNTECRTSYKRFVYFCIHKNFIQLKKKSLFLGVIFTKKIPYKLMKVYLGLSAVMKSWKPILIEIATALIFRNLLMDEKTCPIQMWINSRQLLNVKYFYKKIRNSVFKNDNSETILVSGCMIVTKFPYLLLELLMMLLQ